MKRKVKKFGRGGDVLTGLGAGLIGYHLYDKYMNKDKDKDKEIEAVGGPGRRPRTIEEQTGRKAEPEKRREISDYMTNKSEEKKGGETRPGPDTAEPDLDYKDKKAAPAKKATPAAQPKKPEPAAQPTKDKPRAKAADNASPKSVVFKDATTSTPKASAPAEAPAKIGSQGSFKFDSKPDLSVPKAFDMKSGNKTVYGTDTTSVFQKKAAQERAEAEEKAKKKEKDAAQAKEFRERSLQPMRKGGAVKKYASGGTVKSSASRRADGIAQRGKTRGRIC